MSYFGFAPYVSVSQKASRAKKAAKALEKKSGRKFLPVEISGNRIAETFWGKAWCNNLESYSDFHYRLERGRSYVRHGAVIDLQVLPGKVEALVSGTEVYKVDVEITSLSQPRWNGLKVEALAKIGSLIELLEGKLSKNTMEAITNKETGLFPTPKEIKFRCSCPDYASMCKHVAATLYGIGTRFDRNPELLFPLRNVDHLELFAVSTYSDKIKKNEKTADLSDNDISELFNIEVAETSPNRKGAKNAPKRRLTSLWSKKSLGPKRSKTVKSPPESKTLKTKKIGTRAKKKAKSAEDI